MDNAIGVLHQQRRVVGQPVWLAHTPCVAANNDPEAALRAASTRRKRAERAVTEARADERAAIVAALDAGLRQVDIVRITGWTRETVRRLADAEREARATG
jgi:DNA-directed RNA polymerase specialized sigma24 family protein